MAIGSRTAAETANNFLPLEPNIDPNRQRDPKTCIAKSKPLN
jgi:hypothetical protein